ncbi:hypothetical protein CIB48_g3770 [Xylaria polymorpha]|nr:hypothetical protein CIB48_g3770 [Xylaria polymorpha]
MAAVDPIDTREQAEAEAEGRHGYGMAWMVLAKLPRVSKRIGAAISNAVMLWVSTGGCLMMAKLCDRRQSGSGCWKIKPCFSGNRHGAEWQCYQAPRRNNLRLTSPRE